MGRNEDSLILLAERSQGEHLNVLYPRVLRSSTLKREETLISLGSNKPYGLGTRAKGAGRLGHLLCS